MDGKQQTVADIQNLYASMTGDEQASRFQELDKNMTIFNDKWPEIVGRVTELGALYAGARAQVDEYRALDVQERAWMRVVADLLRQQDEHPTVDLEEVSLSCVVDPCT